LQQSKAESFLREWAPLAERWPELNQRGTPADPEGLAEAFELASQTLRVTLWRNHHILINGLTGWHLSCNGLMKIPAVIGAWSAVLSP
jgi:hypothetical protein